MPALMVYAAAI